MNVYGKDRANKQVYGLLEQAKNSVITDLV